MDSMISESPETRIRVLYDELHRVAVLMMRKERPGHTWGPSGLVHEALACLIARGELEKDCDRRELMASAVEAMRRLLIDHYRRKSAQMRGGGWRAHPLDRVLDHFESREGHRFTDLHEAIDELAGLEARQALVVNFRYFLGRSVPEVEEVLGVSRSTVESDWRAARAFLLMRLGESRCDDT